MSRLAPFLFTTLLCCTAFANDAEFSNISGSPEPIKNSSITMLSEDIEITRNKQGEWDIVALYRFKNSTDKKVSLTIGFPEFFGDQEKEFLKFQTTVRGKKVKTVATAKKGKKKKEGDLGRVHLFDATFEPNETVAIEHRYSMSGGGSVAIANETFVDYVTKTGALWNGPIGRATFTIRTRDVYELIAVPTSYRVKSLKRFVIQKGERTGMELVLEMENWTPTQDLSVALFSDHPDHSIRAKLVGKCPNHDLSDWKKFDEASRKEKPKFVTVENLKPFSGKQLRLCRNWIYARYGYAFKDPKLRKRFYRDIANGKYPPLDMIEENDRSTQKLIWPNVDPQFSTDMLKIEELVYIEALKAEEKRRKTKDKK